MTINNRRQRQALHHASLERPLDGIALELATSCNLSCKMCSEWKSRAKAIAHDKIVSLLAEARSLGAERFYSCGTEPFVREDTPDILAYAERSGFSEICIVSNGLLLNNTRTLESLEKLKTLNIVVSLDGPQEVHDNLRGKGTFEGALKALRELQRRSITCSIASIIMRQTLGSLHEIVDLAADLGIPVISMQPYQRETAGLDSDHAPFEFRPEEENDIVKKLDRLMRHAESKKVKLYTAGMMRHVPACLVRGTRHIPPGGCYVPTRLMIVDSSGECYPCFMMRERLKSKSMGNVNEKPLNKIWHSSMHRELSLLGLNRKCPACLAACGDVESYDKMAQRGWLSRQIIRLTGK